MQVKDLTARGKKGRKVRGGGGGVPGLSTTTITTSLSKVGAFRPIGVTGPCDRPR
jgi:hypothetical protein